MHLRLSLETATAAASTCDLIEIGMIQIDDELNTATSTSSRRSSSSSDAEIVIRSNIFENDSTDEEINNKENDHENEQQEGEEGEEEMYLVK